LLDKARSGIEAIRPSVDRVPTWQAANENLRNATRTQVLIRVNDDVRSWKEWIFRDAEGIMFAEMVHFIDLAVWFNKGRPIRLFAEGSNEGNFTLILKFDDGSITTLQQTMNGHFDYPKELFEATTHNITVALDHHIELRQFGMADEPVLQTFPYVSGCEWAVKEGMAGYMFSVAEEEKRAAAEGRPRRMLFPNKGHYEHHNRFLDHLEGKGPNPCDVESAVIVNQLAVKFIESSGKGLPLAVSL
jgi:predicted dehydrogenase